jgi:hypothetical protein
LSGGVSAAALLFVCPFEQPKTSMLVKNVVRIGSLIKIAAYVEALAMWWYLKNV